jgi:8-oxo-dGTP diphosphatase
LSEKYKKGEMDWITSRFICFGYYALVAISKVKPITDEFDKTFELKSAHEIPDHKVILEEVLIALIQKIGLSFLKTLENGCQ